VIQTSARRVCSYVPSRSTAPTDAGAATNGRTSSGNRSAVLRICSTSDVTATVFTIGYERRSQDGLVRDLAQAGVSLLADVRELPLSRRQGFSKTALGRALEEAGIGYAHYRALGNLKPYRDAWKRGDSAAGAAGYLAHIGGDSSEAVDTLAVRVAEGGVCLLCVEHEPERCHRALLADSLRERLGELDVRHL
jgi:uncharacterized protein (DUF488 family)